MSCQNAEELARIETERRQRITKHIAAMFAVNVDSLVDFIIEQDSQAQDRIRELSVENARFRNGAAMRDALARIKELESELSSSKGLERIDVEGAEAVVARTAEIESKLRDEFDQLKAGPECFGGSDYP